MSAENETYDGDALMAAITGEELTEEARGDAAFLAEYRSAEEDIALLRDQLGIIGETLSAPEPAEKPVRVRSPRARRHVRTLAFGTLAVAAVAGVVTGLGWLIGHTDPIALSDGDSGSSASKAESGVRFGGPAYLSCATTVAEGEVTAVEELPGGEELRVTVRIDRYFKPTAGPKELTYVIGAYDVSRPLTKGARVLFGVTEGSASPDHWVVGEREIAVERAWITASLPEARGLACGG